MKLSSWINSVNEREKYLSLVRYYEQIDQYPCNRQHAPSEDIDLDIVSENSHHYDD